MQGGLEERELIAEFPSLTILEVPGEIPPLVAELRMRAVIVGEDEGTGAGDLGETSGSGRVGGGPAVAEQGGQG